MLAHTRRFSRVRSLLRTTGSAPSFIESLEALEPRRLMSLSGVTLNQLPLGFYDASGQAAYEASSGALDVSATPTAVFFPGVGPRPITATHGDFQIHLRTDAAGNLLRGVVPGDIANRGAVNANGDDFIMRGGIDIDGDGSIDPLTETGDLLRGEIYAFGFQDGGEPNEASTDFYDFRFAVTGGLLAPFFAGRDLGVIMESENSSFSNSFGVDFTGQAKGSIGPINQPMSSSIGGFVYEDCDNDGVYEPGDEEPIPGTLVTLTGTDHAGQAVSRSTFTQADGSYLFADLRPGTYQLDETQPAGFFDGRDTIGTPGGTTANDRFSAIVLPADFNGVNNNFGELTPSSLAGFVYLDANDDGIRQASETGISGVTITLSGIDDLGAPVSQVRQTLADGSYRFENLRPGTYAIQETQPSSFADGSDTIGTPGGTTADDRFSNIFLGACFDGENNNFGERRRGEISGRKFLDITGNGLTSDDTGFGGVTVYIDANNSGARDPGERATTTAANGDYSFSNLPAGTYIIREIVPPDFVRTAPVLTDRYVVTLTTGQVATGFDFANAEMCDMDDITSYHFLINGTRAVTDLRGNTNQGDEVTVVFTIAAGNLPHVYTFVSYTAPDNYFNADNAHLQQIYDLETGVFGPGTHSMTIIIPDCNYQIDFVCGEAIDRFGPAGSNIFYTPQNRLFSADNDGCNDCVTNASRITGNVYIDLDNDGVIDNGENGISGVPVTLTGTDNNGRSVNITKSTYSDGSFSFGNLRPGTYRVTEAQPEHFNDGRETVGTRGGSRPSNDVMSNIVLPASTVASDYLFGERLCSGTTVTDGQTATIGFWRSLEGQGLIQSLNGSSSARNLGNWLASNFSKLFGNYAGSEFNLSGRTNTQVATAFAARFDAGGAQLEAQILATALSIYVTSSSLAGGNYASAYGFSVTSAGIGALTFNVGSAGSLLGVSNGSSRSVMDLVRRASDRASGGRLFASNASARGDLADMFFSINILGGIH